MLSIKIGSSLNRFKSRASSGGGSSGIVNPPPVVSPGTAPPASGRLLETLLDENDNSVTYASSQYEVDDIAQKFENCFMDIKQNHEYLTCYTSSNH